MTKTPKLQRGDLVQLVKLDAYNCEEGLEKGDCGVLIAFNPHYGTGVMWGWRRVPQGDTIGKFFEHELRLLRRAP